MGIIRERESIQITQNEVYIENETQSGFSRTVMQVVSAWFCISIHDVALTGTD